MQMSLPSPNGRKRPTATIGERPETAGDGVLTLGESLATATTAQVTTPGSKQRTDYRLRGLDLGAQHKSHPPVRPARKEQSRRRHRRRVLVGWVVVVTLTVGVALLLRATVIEPFSVPSASMVPTLQAGDRIVVAKSSFLAGPIQRGSIVVFQHPSPDPCSAGGAAQNLVQRVIGLPGQTIWSHGRTIYVDGRKLRELGWYDPRYGPVGSKAIPLTTVPAGEYFVMGDNRSQSCDSRSFGAVPASSIVGKVVSIVLRGGHPYVHVF